jgi:hypothetical protein
LEHRVSGGAGKGVTGVSRANSDRVYFEVVENFLAHSNSSEGSVSSSNSLRESIHIGDDTFVVLETKHFTRTTESLHNFIRD